MVTMTPHLPGQNLWVSIVKLQPLKITTATNFLVFLLTHISSCTTPAPQKNITIPDLQLKNSETQRS